MTTCPICNSENIDNAAFCSNCGERISANPNNNTQDQQKYQPQDQAYQPQDQAYQPQDQAYQPQDQAYQPQDQAYQPQDQAYQPQDQAYQQQPYQQPYQQQPYQQPYQQPQYPNNQGQNIPPGYEQKSKIAAGLLNIFLGSFGVGRFYLGYTNIGVLQLLVSLITCGAGSIWGLIDGIMILTGNPSVDANGVPLKD